MNKGCIHLRCSGLKRLITTHDVANNKIGNRLTINAAVLMAFWAILETSAVSGAPVSPNALPTYNGPTLTPTYGTGSVATSVTNSVTHPNLMTVTQSSDKMIVDWNTFNIGSAAAVNFVQPNSNSAVLNRVLTTGGASNIYGNLTANGQVYLINPNGILFGAGSSVNVNSLIASSLGISNSVFLNGILSIRDGSAAFSGDSTSGLLQVEDGAVLSAASGGKIMMFAPAIQNNGLIQTPDGQTLLAAGQKVYLYGSSDPNMRGLLVEIDNGGKTENQDLGRIVAERGNVTLAGIAVNQNGRVRATTSLISNGSIILKAQDTTNTVDITTIPGVVRRRPTSAGEVVFGTGSLTEVLPDNQDTSTVLDSVTVNQSLIEVSAKSIHLMNDALIVAPSGQVNLIAISHPDNPTILNINSSANPNDSHIYFEAGSGVDVSGVGSGSALSDRAGETAALLSVATNVVQAELRSNELKDSPLQRAGILKAAKVFVDSRLTGPDGSVGTSVADVSGYTSQITHGLSERLANGGSVKIQSEGDIVFAPSAFIDVSGGKVNYAGDIVTKTMLLSSNGLSYDIANAPKDVTYTEIQNINYYEHGYTTGKDAGSISFSAPSMVLEGKLSGGVVIGERQRSLQSMPNGATLQIGQNKINPSDSDALTLAQTYVLHSDLILDASHVADILPVYSNSYSLSQAQQQTLTLGNNFTGLTGFKNLFYYADGQITLKSGTNLNAMPGGKITLNGGGVDIQGNLVTHGGAINLSSKVMTAYVGNQPNFTLNTQNNVEIGGSSSLDVSGVWVNDSLITATNDLIVTGGGSINISASSYQNPNGNIVLNTGSILNASGGAWLHNNGKLSAGNAGAITLLASDGIGNGLDLTHAGKLILNGTLRADSIATGGSLSISSGSITIGSNALGTTNGETLIDPAFFQKGGFTSYAVNGFEGLLVEDNVTISPKALTRVLDSTYLLQQSGEDLQKFSHLSMLPASNGALTRNATSLSLSASNQWNGKLSLGSGSTILTDPGASVSLLGKRQLTVLGSVLAPAGNISMTSGLVSGEKNAVDFNSDQTLWLGEQSILDVSGVVSSYRNPLGFTVGKVLNAGSIVLTATKGEVVANAGTKIYLDGTHAPLDVKSGGIYVSEEVASKGGSLSISAREGIFWDATMSARGGSNAVSAGNFSFSLPLLALDSVSATNVNNGYQYPTGPREIILKSTGSSVPNTLKPGDTIDLSNNGMAYVFADKLQNAGFETLAFTKSDNIRFDGSITLKTRGAITLDAPNVSLNDGVTALIEASYVSMGNGQSLSRTQLPFHLTTISPVTGNGTLQVKADYIDLFGQQNLHGVANADFYSTGDIQLRGVLQNAQDPAGNVPITTPLGILQTAGDIAFTAVSIYPSTLSNYTLSATGANSIITFNPSANVAGVPFSVLGVVNVAAQTIQQNGVIRAPFGEINLNATNQLTLGANSLTSVSAEGSTMPFGSTLNLRDWNFYEGDRIATLSTLPDKKITLDANSVNILSGSKVDVSGGGDLAAWEFTAGTGGSKDVLSGSGVFAILPQYKAGYMPGNSESYSNNTINAGDSIYLSGGNGLAAGQYMLLPAHYALLPGAFSVKLVNATQNYSPQQNTLNPDGSMLVSGYRMQYGGLVTDTQTNGFLVTSGNIARTQSEFTSTSASSFFTTAYSNAQLTGYRLPDDAGRLAIIAATGMVLDGEMVLGGKKNSLGQPIGRSAEVDISSNQIAISGDKSIVGASGYLTLLDTKLNGMGAESLLIGGQRSSVAEGTKLDVTATNVELIGGATLKGSDLILAANDKVLVDSGASITAAGLPTTNIGKLIIGNDEIKDALGNVTTAAVSGDGALLRVSSGQQLDLVRYHLSANPALGTINLNGSIDQAQAVILDATFSNAINGSVNLLTGGALSVGAPLISFGATNNSVGLVYDKTTNALVVPSDLKLKSYSTIDFTGNVTLGDATTTQNISLQALGMNYGGADKVTINAKSVKFSGLNNDPFVPGIGLGSGTLEVNANEIITGVNTFHTAGFSTVQLNADQVIGRDLGGLDIVGNLNINAERITTASLADQTIKASGELHTLMRSTSVFNGTDPATMPAPVGGKLTLTANNINHEGNIEMPGGIVTLKATGAGDSLILKAGSQISAKGSAQMLGSVPVLVDGGKINLQATNGNIRMEGFALLDVSATGGAGSGVLSINSAGTADLAGTLNGSAVADNNVANPSQGSFVYYASTLNGKYSDLNGLLNAGHFNESQNIHVSNGDITLSSADTITAHNVTLTTDDGNIAINGQIDASGAKGGIVSLNAGQKSNDGNGNVTLTSSAKIDVSATAAATGTAGSSGNGGKVTLNSSTDSDTSPATGSTITLSANSQIDLSGKGMGTDGTLVLRAPRIGVSSFNNEGTGVAVTLESGAKLIGNNATILVEGVKTYKTDTIDAAYVSTIQTHNTNFLTNASGAFSDNRILVVAGDEIQSASNITIVDDIDFHSWGPGAITLRAAGDINVNGNLSAGFANVTSGIMTAGANGHMTGGGVWSYRMIAGADLQSADIMSTNNNKTGNFTLAADKLIRTGTGDVVIATGNDFTLGSLGSVIYTAGELDLNNYGSLINNIYGARAQYSNNGGDINLNSKGQINGAYTNQIPANWQFRQGNNNPSYKSDTSWWTSFANFKENIGALGGGDVNIASGGSISNLSAVVATNGRVYGTGSTNAKLVVNGGGDISIYSGGDISGGVYMVDKGLLKIRADGGLVPGILPDLTAMTTAIALGDGKADVKTMGALNLNTVFNPTMAGMSPSNLTTREVAKYSSLFSTYSTDSAASFTSINGEVNVSLDYRLFSNASLNASTVLNLFPGTLSLAALGGDLTIGGSQMALMPAAQGNLKLAANGTINLNAPINMSDNNVNVMPSPLTPLKYSDFNIALPKIMNTLTLNSELYHDAIPVHQSDNQPVVLYAGNNIVGTGSVSLFLPKKADIYAVNDIINLALFGQNLNPSDVTSITAGHDIVNPMNGVAGIMWGGPGYLDISAGRNIDLNTSDGIVTRGNLDSPFLPESGANLSVMVGTANANNQAFINKYLNPSASNSYSDALISFIREVKSLKPEDQLTAADAWTDFAGLDAKLKSQFVESVFFNELKQAGIEHNDQNSNGFGNYNRGFDAIASYFSNNIPSGKLDLSFSQLKTERSGNINILAPGGDVVVGLPVIPQTILNSKQANGQNPAAKLGIFTVKNGDINVFAKSNIDVAQSREFTIAGGDILDWSTLGNIDAGKGSKTATSAPPPLIRIDPQGNTIIDLSGVVSGSGIGTLQTLKDAPLGNVYLIAPFGTVDAGDAGVRSSGNLLVAAQAVANGANMQAGGATSGVPAPSTTSVSFNAPVSADSSNSAKQGDKLSDAASKSSNNKDSNVMPSLITVEVLALGGDSGSSSEQNSDEKVKSKK